MLDVVHDLAIIDAWKSTSTRPRPTSPACWSGSRWVRKSSSPRPEHLWPSSCQLSRRLAALNSDQPREKLSLPMTSMILFRKRSKICSGNESPVGYSHFYMGDHRRETAVSQSAHSDRLVGAMVECGELVGSDSEGAGRKALTRASGRSLPDRRT